MRALQNYLLHPPAHLINGVSVALGIGLIQVLVSAIGGPAAALAAVTGAVCSSLADVPVTPNRTWRRVLTAAIIACTVSLVVHLLRPYPMTLGLMVGVITFLATMMLVWGPRAGPTSFVGILAFIFSLAAPPIQGLEPILAQAGWTAAGALLYFSWSVASSALLQPRYRSLALAAALAATAQLLRSRADLVSGAKTHSDDSPELQAWIATEAQLDERLQLARDLLFVKLDTEAGQRQAALLLLAIDLRDTLLTSELDVDLLGEDQAGRQVRQVLAADLIACAIAVADIEAAVHYGRALPSRAAAGVVRISPVRGS
jgi:uncharacterized membrane protein YccC